MAHLTVVGILKSCICLNNVIEVKELTAEVAADPSTRGDRELPKQPALKPKCLFPPPEAPPEDQFPGLKDSLQRDRKRKTMSDQRFRVQTSKGKKVLSSDMRLHLEKKERLKAQNQENPEDSLDSDEELEFLEHEAQRLQAKLERKREIHRLRRELQQTTVQIEGQDDEFYDKDDAEYEYEPSAESTYLQPRERRQRTVSSADVSRQIESTESISHEEFAKMQEEIAQMRTLMRNQEGFETVSESPLSLVLEKARIDRTLKTPALDHFDGSSDPLAFLNTFDGRMAFFGHSEIDRCQFFSTCLQGTALRWYSNLAPRSIDSWTTLKSKFQARFSSNYKGIKVTASLMTMHQRSGESLRSFLTRFREEITEILDLIEQMAVNFLTAGIDKSRHGLLLEEIFKKRPKTLQAAFQIIEHRMMLQEAVSCIQSPRRSSKYERRRSYSPRSPRGKGAESAVAARGLSHNSRKIYAREVFNVNPSAAKRPRANPSPVISFSDDEYHPGLIEGHQDALVITTRVGNNTVKKMLVDNGSSVDVLYHHAFSRMDIGDRRLENSRTPLHGFTGNEVHVVGTINMPVLFGSPPCQIWKMVKFHVISASSSFNAILGRTTITALRAITSISHLKMKFPTDFGVGEMIGDQVTARQCYLTTVSPRKKTEEELEVNQVLDIDPRELIDTSTSNSCSPLEETEDIEVFEGNPDKTTRIGKNLSSDLKKEITNLIREFSDIFAWAPTDMPGIPETIARQSLHISRDTRPVRQKQRIFSAEKRAAIDQEVDRLLDAGFIEPVQFPTWISNVVLVKKSNGKWRMCIDYSE
ncbi:hypothetical protein AgCh_030993 [Apium graveolens]